MIVFLMLTAMMVGLVMDALIGKIWELILQGTDHVFISIIIELKDLAKTPLQFIRYIQRVLA